MWKDVLLRPPLFLSCLPSPELPGAPTNLGISNIGPRSVTLQFRPGYDGKTSISRWLVEAQGSDSEYEVDLSHQKAHSFVNHYISDPTYYNSWRRQQKGISRAQANSYPESDSGEPDRAAIVNSGGAPQGSLFRPKASRTPTPPKPPNPPSQQSTLYRPPSSLTPGSRAPIAGFSSFV
ncbi:Protein sidekick-2 [Pteropus alecto]|uniref:Protein sidekick-2 n=1 Tax=Pteropus alecto TaxID=9402 RepID=L5KP70_PTEAL|nr:Protein sidekick-2 [Pteropus alecto]